MDANTISRLAELLHNSWNSTSTKKDIKKSINGLLHRKKTSNVISEYREFLDTLPEEKKKETPIMTVILVLALCRRNLDEEEIIYKELKKHNLISALYGGLSILLNGTSKQLSINIKWQDKSFKNKYKFIKRFEGQFLYWDCIEVFIAAKVIQLDNSSLFEELILKDRSRLLLLNMTSGYLGGEISDQLILTLMTDKDELNQNIGFVSLTAKLNRHIEELKQYLRDEELGITGLHSDIRNINSQIDRELKRIAAMLTFCNIDTKASLLINYLLSEAPTFPKVLAAWLLEPELQHVFIEEIKYSGKVKTLDQVYYLLSIVSNTRRTKTSSRYPKIKLYNAFVDLMLSFVKERKGIYQWTEREEQVLTRICEFLPKKSKRRLLKLLIKETDDILYLKIDELVRFQIFLKDRNKKDIINGMICIINKDLNEK